MAELGYGAILLTLALALYTLVAAWGFGRRNDTADGISVRNSALLGAATCTVAVASLLGLLLTRDYGVKYVYEHVNHYLPFGYTVSAFWAGQEGSLLLWLWFVSLFSLVVAIQKRAWGRCGIYTHAVMALTQAFLALVLLFASNPFAKLPFAAADGRGMNPLLQNFWMALHPPAVFAGYAAYTAPFALALGGLVVRQVNQEWLRAVRQWALLAWLLLGAGILMGAYWAYLELGWGGYWNWDPVENASLIPWLIGTALLHSLIAQERKGIFRTWNVWLAGAPFLLCHFATFVTRSGIIRSVHAFLRSSLGYYFIGFILLCLVALTILALSRRQELSAVEDQISFLSREAVLLLTILLFMGAAAILLGGILSSALGELVWGEQRTLSSSFYKRTVGPLAQAIVFLIGICPWLAWEGVSPERLRRDLLPPFVAGLAAALILFTLGIRQGLPSVAICAVVASSIMSLLWRDARSRHRSAGERLPSLLPGILRSGRRRYGGDLAHLGITLIALGVTGSSLYQNETQFNLAPGESVTIQGYTFAYHKLLNENTPLCDRFIARVETSRVGEQAVTLMPSKEFYRGTQQWVIRVAIHSGLREDLYIALTGFEQDGAASFRLLVNPLVAWFWIGGIVLLGGGVLAWWPMTQKTEQERQIL